LVAKAIHRNFGMSPAKVRRILGLIKNKPVGEALAALKFRSTPAAKAVAKVIRSAAANGENNEFMAADDLRIIGAYADDAPRLKRFRPQSRGRINPIIRRSCHITVFVGEEGAKLGT